MTPGRRWTVSDLSLPLWGTHETVIWSSFILVSNSVYENERLMWIVTHDGPPVRCNHVSCYGACIAEHKDRVVGRLNQSILGEELRKSIRVVNFTGASGPVFKFGPTTSLLEGLGTIHARQRARQRQ